MGQELNSEMSLEELKNYKTKIEAEYANSLNNTRKLNDILMERLETGSTTYTVNPEKTEKLKHLIEKLSNLLAERMELAKSVESKHIALKTLYLEHKDKYLTKEEPVKLQAETKVSDVPVISEELQKEFITAQSERDKALGLVKVLLATLKSSRMQSEENFHKLKYSADLMFHIMYKAEDAFLGGEQSIDK